MRKIFSTTLLVLALVNPAFAAPPSDASLQRLMTITEMQKMVGGMFAQVDEAMNRSIQQAVGGRKITPAQQTAIDNMKLKTVNLLKQEYTWEKLQPVFARIYRESFTQDEVNGMIDFYTTPTGQAVIRKLPLVMQKSMQEMQSTIGALAPEIEKIQREFVKDLMELEKTPPRS